MSVSLVTGFVGLRIEISGEVLCIAIAVRVLKDRITYPVG